MTREKQNDHGVCRACGLRTTCSKDCYVMDKITGKIIENPDLKFNYNRQKKKKS